MEQPPVITPPEVVKLMDEKSVPFVIVDVRDEDREIGWIRDSVSFPACDMTSRNLHDLMDGLVAAKVQLLVVHCMFSQTRGPKVAAAMMDVLGKKRLNAPQVRVLQGGFKGFRASLGDTRPELLQKKQRGG